MKRFLSCLLSAALWTNSFPLAGWAQMGARSIPSGGGFQPSGATFASGLELYRWLSSSPQFSRNPAFSAQVLIQAAPLIQKGPVKASLEGNRIVLVPDRSDFEPLYIELPGTGGPVSQSAALLARELQRALGTDEKEGGVSHSSRVLSRFFESFSSPAPESEALPVKVSVSEGSSPAPAASRQDIWLNLERWIQEGLDLKVSGKTEEWKKATVEILRNNPSLPLTKALPRGFAGTYGLNPETEKKIEFFLANPGMRRELKNATVDSVDRLRGALYVITDNGLYKFIKGGRTMPVLTDAGRVHKITQIGDSIYVGADKGLYRLNGGEAVPVLTEAGAVYEITQIGGSIYVGADKGLYRLKGGKAVPVLRDVGWVSEIFRIGGSLYVRADKGLYKLKGGKAVPVLRGVGWVSGIFRIGGSLYVDAVKGLYKLKGGKAVPVLRDAGPVREITQVEDSIYVGADKGLYKLKGGKAVPVLREAGRVYEITQIGGSIYVGADKGLYRLKGGKAVPVLRDVGWVWEITQIGDSVYVGADTGFYKLKGDEAVPVLKGVNIRQIKEGDGKMYLVADKGFFTWHLPPENLKSWKQSVLEEASKTIGQMQESPGPASPAEPLKTDEKGNILGEDGRTLFSGLQGGSR